MNVASRSDYAAVIAKWAVTLYFTQMFPVISATTRMPVRLMAC